MTVGRMRKREERRRTGRWRNEIGNDKRRRRSVSESSTLVTTADGPKMAQDVFILLYRVILRYSYRILYCTSTKLNLDL